MDETFDPVVTEPPGFDLKAAWDSCKEDRENVVDEHGEVNWGAAFGADPGVCRCPACGRWHWAWGHAQRCTDPACGFEYPTDWWPRVSAGSSDRGGPDSAPHAPARPACPYYMTGWRNPGLAYDDYDRFDWRTVVADFTPWAPTPAEADAVEAEAARGDCVHYRGTRERLCGAGVGVRALVGGPDLGWATRLPCIAALRNRANGPTVACPKFSTLTPEERARADADDDARVAEAGRRMKALSPLWSRVKKEHKNRDGRRFVGGRGSEPCPACGGTIHWTHSAYNGHCSFRCETEGCINTRE